MECQTDLVRAKARAATTEHLLLEAQKDSLSQARLPSRNYPTTLSHDGLEWLVTYTDAEGAPLLVGRGGSPFAAYLNFDEKWIGTDE
jgi:hypothetical protein